MPKRNTATKEETHRTLKNCSFESLIVHWLMYDGWQVFTPNLDNGHQTDILISDGPNYYRIQVKTVKADSRDDILENQWKESNVDVIVVFARDSNWGYVIPAFTEDKIKFSAKGNETFHSEKRNEFLKAFHKV